jgi:Ras-related GTP-binding protein A/B
MEVGNSSFTAYIDMFTTNTYIMVIASHPHIHTATTQINVRAARPLFETFIP